MRPEEVATLDPYKIRKEVLVEDARDLLGEEAAVPQPEPPAQTIPDPEKKENIMPKILPLPTKVPPYKSGLPEEILKKSPLISPFPAKENFKNTLRYDEEIMKKINPDDLDIG